MVRPLVVVEAQVALEGGLELPEAGEVAAAELDAPVLVKDRLLETLDEAVGEGVARLGPRVAGAFELAASIGEDALERVAGPAEEGGHLLAQEVGDDLRSWGADKDLGQGEGGSGIAGRDLPDLPDALELTDEEAVEADELARSARLDVTLRGRRTGLLELLPGALGEEAGLLGAVGLQQSEALLVGAQAEPTQGPVDGAGSGADTSEGELVGELAGAPGGPGERQSDDLALDDRLELRRAAGLAAAPRGMEAIGSIARKPLPELVVERAGDAQLAAGCAHIPEFLGATEEMQPKGVYLVFEGQRTTSCVLVWRQELRRLAPLALLTSGSEVCRPLRHSSG